MRPGCYYDYYLDIVWGIMEVVLRQATSGQDSDRGAMQQDIAKMIFRKLDGTHSPAKVLFVQKSR